MPQPLNKDYADIKAGVSGVLDAPDPDGLPEAPAAESTLPETTEETAPEESFAPPQNTLEQYAAPQNSAALDVDKIHEVAEAIVNERWEEFLGRVGDIAVWKERTETNIISMKQEIIRINQKFDNLQNAILGKIKEYDTDMKDVHTEMKALEKVFEKISEPLVMNIKELGRITQELKKVR